MAVIFAGVKGYPDGVALADIGRFEIGLLDQLRGSGKKILASIRDEKSISDKTEKDLHDLIGSFSLSLLEMNRRELRYLAVDLMWEITDAKFEGSENTD